MSEFKIKILLMERNKPAKKAGSHLDPHRLTQLVAFRMRWPEAALQWKGSFRFAPQAPSLPFDGLLINFAIFGMSNDARMFETFQDSESLLCGEFLAVSRKVRPTQINFGSKSANTPH